MPKFFLRYKFGRANRASRSFEEVIARYNEKLQNVGNMVSPFSQNMPLAKSSDKKMTLEKWTEINQKINAKVLKISDFDLDNLVLPHPLMGKMTLREILMWNAYHVKHHYVLLLKNYG